MQLRIRDTVLFEGIERSALVIASVLRMLVGLGLAIGLILQVYMFVLTDLTCAADVRSLGNAIRCTNPLNMIANALYLIVGLGVAMALFSPRRLDLMETVLMVLCAVAISFLSDFSFADASWNAALSLFALVFAVAGLTTVRRLLPAQPNEPSDE